MAIKSSRDSSVGLLARRTRTVKRCSSHARSEAQPSHPTMTRRNASYDCVVRWKKVCVSIYRVIAAVTVLSLVACAGGPEPMLRSNAKLQLQGREAGKLDVAACQKKAEVAGLKPGTSNRSGNVAAGATLGLIGGAAVGASAGIIGGVAGVAIGAAAGGALGAIIGSVGGAYRPLDPDPPYGDAVVRCLLEKGYDVSGWQ
jgi:hypothetical protein